MYWKLRIPLLLGVIGVISGFVQKFPALFLVDTSYFLRNAVFIGSIVLIFLILEKTDVNDKKVHSTIGVGMILSGITFDYFMV